jgi:TRAP-type uncharacterized transport system fused permease subunit
MEKDQDGRVVEGELASGAVELTEEQKKRLEELIEEEEGVTKEVQGFWNVVITVLAVAMSGFAIYSAVFPVTTQIVRATHVRSSLPSRFSTIRSPRDSKARLPYSTFCSP